MEDINGEERDALCPECGHAFKAFIDRILPEEKESRHESGANCPVCGCGECQIN